jgi:hypothetical protein
LNSIRRASAAASQGPPISADVPDQYQRHFRTATTGQGRPQRCRLGERATSVELLLLRDHDSRNLGALLIARKDSAQGASLRAWIDHQVLGRFEGRVLAIDTVVAQRCARLHVPDKRAERDALIAATALVHGLTVVTRNLADFEAAGVALINPWLPRQAGKD